MEYLCYDLFYERGDLEDYGKKCWRSHSSEKGLPCCTISRGARQLFYNCICMILCSCLCEAHSICRKHEGNDLEAAHLMCAISWICEEML